MNRAYTVIYMDLIMCETQQVNYGIYNLHNAAQTYKCVEFPVV